MYMCHDLNYTNIWESLFEDLPKCVKQNESQMPPQALVYVVRACFYSVVWSLHAFEERLAAGGAGATAGGAADTLKERLHAYTAHCKDIVANGITPELKEEVLGILFFFVILHVATVDLHISQYQVKQLIKF